MATNLGIGSLADKLRLAASKGQFDKVEELLRSGANTYDTDNEGRTALHLASYHGYLEIAQILLDAGSDVNAQDHMGYTPLHRASSQGHREIISLLISRGCSLDIQDRVHGNAAVHEAAWNGFSESLDILIKAKARVFLTNKSGFTALHLASQNGHNQSARVILYGNANPDVKNNYGDTPLHTAARYGHAGVTRILVSARCQINEQNKNGDTALHIATALKRRKITKLVVESGIDINVRNKQGETATDVARRKDHSEVISIIMNQPKVPRRQPNGDDLDGTRTISMSMSDPDLVEDKGFEKEPKKSKFPFFRKKTKKSKNKEKYQPKSGHPTRVPPQGGSDQAPGHGTSPHQGQPMEPGRPGQPPRTTVGFFNQYVPRPGVQYYRDLAGNIKQGPVGFAPVCQCMPALKQFEQKMANDHHNVYDHVEAARRILTEQVDLLDQRAQQQAFHFNERLESEEEACHGRINRRSLEDRNYQEHFVEEKAGVLKHELQSWTADRIKSLERRVVRGHHHDDADWTHGRPHRSGGMMQSFNYDNIVQGRLYRTRSDETLSVSEYNQKQKTEREMAHQVALRELRTMQRARTTGTERWRERNANRREAISGRPDGDQDIARRTQSVGREPAPGRETVQEINRRSQSSGRGPAQGREVHVDHPTTRERVPVRSYPRREKIANRPQPQPRVRVQVHEPPLSREQYMNESPQRQYPNRLEKVQVQVRPHPRDLPLKSENMSHQEGVFDGQEQKTAKLRTSPDGHNFHNYMESNNDYQTINRNGFYSPRKVQSQDELSPQKGPASVQKPDISAKSSPNISEGADPPQRRLNPSLIQRFEKLDTNGNVHSDRPKSVLPYNKDNYYDHHNKLQTEVKSPQSPIKDGRRKSEPLLDVPSRDNSFSHNSSYERNSGYQRNSLDISANYSHSSNYSDSYNHSGNYYNVQHSTANFDNNNHNESEPPYAYIIPKHQKADSGSNPDSGYSSKIYGVKVLPTPRQGTGSPHTQSSTCSTGHNISSITSTSISTDQSFPSTQSSPVSCASDNDLNQKQYYERVSQEMNRYYQRRLQQHPPSPGDEGRLHFINPRLKSVDEKTLESVTATDV